MISDSDDGTWEFLFQACDSKAKCFEAKEGAGVSTQFAVKSADRKGLVSRNACF